MQRTRAVAIVSAVLCLARSSLAQQPSPESTEAAAPEDDAEGEAETSSDAVAPAEDAAKARARPHFEAGIAAYADGRFKDAIDAFLEANRIYPSPVLSYNTARAYEQLRDTSGALSFYRDYLRRAPGAEDADAVAEKVAGLEKKLREKGVQQVTILSAPDGATAVIDGRPVGVTPWTGELYPGNHRLELRLRGYEDATRDFDLPPHRAIDVTLDLHPEPKPEPPPVVPAEPVAPPPPEPSGPRVGFLTWGALGAGAGVLGAALGFELSSARAEDDARNASTQVAADRKFHDMQRRQKTARGLVGIGAGVTAAGIAMLVLDLTASDGSGDAGRRLPERRRVWAGAACAPGGCAVGVDGAF